MYIQPYPSSMSDACSFHSVRSNQQLYNQLQFPVTSNYGSMKKKKKKPVVTVNGHNLSQELDGQGGLGRSQSLGDLQSSQVSLVPGHNSSQVSLVPDNSAAAAVMYLPELVSLTKPNTN